MVDYIKEKLITEPGSVRDWNVRRVLGDFHEKGVYNLLTDERLVALIEKDLAHDARWWCYEVAEGWWEDLKQSPWEQGQHPICLRLEPWQ